MNWDRGRTPPKRTSRVIFSSWVSVVICSLLNLDRYVFKLSSSPYLMVRRYAAACLLLRLAINCVRNRALEEVNLENPDLSAFEFLLVHNILKHKGNTCSFSRTLGRQWFAWNHNTNGTKSGLGSSFCFLSGKGWEFPIGQTIQREYPVRVVWGSAHR